MGSAKYQKEPSPVVGEMTTGGSVRAWLVMRIVDLSI